jgi:hypothetical protein
MKNYRINKIIKRGGLAGAALALIVVFFSANAALAQMNECDAQCRRQLNEVVAATAKYHRESEAFADGFWGSDHCRGVPGLGSMGFHYLNLARASNLTVNANEPELLLYEDAPNGGRRLVAVEYFVPVISNGAPWFDQNTPPPVIDNPAPVLFGQTFNGPMAGHEPGDPWHYDLHVWIWKHNPSGLFASYNPMVQCSE